MSAWRASCVYIYRSARETDIIQELCENRDGRPRLSVLTSFMVSVDVKQY